MNIDIETTVTVVFILLLVAAGAMLFYAIRAFREASRLRFFLKRRQILGRAWQLVFIALLIISGAFLFNRFAEPVTYQVFEPSPTITTTPTVTLTQTATLISTSTQTPTVTDTPEFTPTPLMPAAISEGFTSEVTPNPESVFSNLTFARRLTGEYLPVDASEIFDQPNSILYGSFTYDKMLPNSQWTALWFREGELINYETILWDGASGGYGYTDLTLPSEEWLPGQYEVQIFVGETWKTSGVFEIVGIPPTATPTLTSTVTPTQTETQLPTETLLPTASATTTPIPTATEKPTATEAPSQTPTMTKIPTETLVPAPTRRSTIYR